MTGHPDLAAGVVGTGQGRHFSTGRSMAEVKVEAHGRASFEVFQGSQPPGVPGPPRHVHQDYDEAWYVLSGQMQFKLDQTVLNCVTGDVIFAPRGTAHTFMNPGPEPADLLAIVSPGALSLIEALGQLAASGPPDPVDVIELLGRHNSFVAEAGPPQ